MSLLARVFHLSSERATLRKSPVDSKSPNFSPLSPSTSSSSISGNNTSSQDVRSPYSLTIKIESPPIVLYGNPSESTGSIVSGILKLSNSQSIDLENVKLSLIQTMKYTKPFILPNSNTVASCKDCTKKTIELARWDILTATATFPPGDHAYPFSHLLPGSLPPTSKLGSSQSHSFIKYDLQAVCTTTSGEIKRLSLPINIARSVIRGPDRNSIRIFPPTEVSAKAVLPNVIYPKTTFPIELKIDNVVNSSQQRRWRMRKLNWRIEENIKVKAHACEKHLNKIQSAEKNYSKSNSPKQPNKNMHHSTVTTNVSLIPSPSNQQSQPQVLQDGIPDSEPVNDVENDVEEAIRSGPAHAHENFIQDFISPTGGVTTHHPALTVEPTISPPHPTDTDKHLYLEESRTISHGEIKSGWKSDFSGKGTIELVANINTVGCSTGMVNHIPLLSTDDAPIRSDIKVGANFSCDIDDPTLGVFVNHTMIVEVVVAEELVHNVERRRTSSDGTKELAPVQTNGSINKGSSSKSSSGAAIPPIQMGVPTGAARVLRMQFKLPITERSGLGIAWDDEVPPTYQDVSSLSPPTYNDPSSSPISPVQSGSERSTPAQTPRIIYGRGSTPIMGNFGLDSSQPNIDSLTHINENIQEFAL
ncbi:LDB19 Protein LDB19 [Candida maltosa Xu316]|uniref:LDB19 N-terminal domain-containing protein n=1 Tax=Candida maltosa (strain Xu316) TaxID=1245528 RepID=M3ISY1_CANMX|nr:hypothetical protein G210_5514 [Candida maltosa Xu316]